MSKYSLNLIARELVRVKSMGFDKNSVGRCTLTCTHGQLWCQLASFGVGNIPLKSVHVIWTQLSFKDIATEHCSLELSIEKEFEVISKRFKEVDIASKVNIKTKFQEISFPEKSFIYVPHDKVKTEGVVKARPTKFMRSTKQIPSYFKDVDFIHSQHDSCETEKYSEGHIPQILPPQSIPLLD